MSSHIHFITEANRRGIQSLQQKRYRQAASIFYQGLRLVQLGLATATAADAVNENSHEHDAAVFTPPLALLGESCCIGCCSMTKACNNEDEAIATTSALVPPTDATTRTTTTTLHTSPFWIPISFCRCACTACHTKMAFTFIFNTGLAFHLDGLTTCKHACKSFEKARRLYQMAATLVRQGNFPVTSTEYWAVHDNEVHVQRLQAAANRVMSLASTTSSSSSSNEESNQAQTAWNGFLSVILNLCPFSQYHTAPAA